jgi:hypothetical protein
MTDQPTPPTPENPFPMPQNSVPQSTGIPPVEDVLDSTVAATPNRGKRGLLIGGAVAAVAVVGAGAYAVTSFLGGGADVAEALPADTLGYISIDLDPGGKQQVEAFRTLKKFPGIKDALNEGLPDDLREQFFDYIKTEGDCDLDFKKDLAPWLGTTAAVGAIDGGDADPIPFAVIEVSDEKAAPAGLKKLAACGNSEPGEENWVVADGWATLAETQKEAKQIVAATAEGALADNTGYTKWVDELGDQGIVSFYVSADAPQVLVDTYGGDTEGMEMSGLKDFEGMAGTLRFADAGLELENVGSAADLNESDFSPRAGKDVGALPPDTLAALGFSMPGGYLEKLFDAMEEQGVDLAEASDQLGLSLPEDVQTLLGDSAVLSMGGDFDIDEIVNSGDPSSLPIALTVHGDPDETEQVLAKLTLAHRELRSYVTWDTGDDRLVVGPNGDYRKQLLDEAGGLGDTSAFTSVVPDAEHAVTVFYLDFNGADDWLYKLAEEADPTIAENLKPLGAIGSSGTVDGDIARGLLKITTD